MAVTYLTLYLAGQALQVVEGSQLHFIYASMGATAQPPTPEPYTRPDPFPQYVHDDEIGELLAGAAVPATDPVVASLVSNSSSATALALRAASELLVAEQIGDSSTPIGAVAAAALGVTKVVVSAGEMASTFGASVREPINGAAVFPLDSAAAAEIVSGLVHVPPGWATMNIDVLSLNMGAGAGNVAWRLDLAPLTPDVALSNPPSGQVKIAPAQTPPLLTSTRLATGVAAEDRLYSFELVRVGSDAGDTLPNDVGVVALICTKASEIAPLYVTPSKRPVVTAGDSQVGAVFDNLTWPKVMATTLGVLEGPGADVYNFGFPGETSVALAAKAGAAPAVWEAGGTIPTTGSVQVLLRDHVAMMLWWAPMPCTLAGVPGTLTRDPSQPGGSPSLSYPAVFTRTAPGAATTVPPGTPFISEWSHYRANPTIIMVGRNNSTDPDRVIADTRAMVEWLTALDGKYLVLSQLNGNGRAAINAAHAERYGSHYVDVLSYLASEQALADAGLTPTTDDLAQIAAGEIPTPFYADGAHLNGVGLTRMGVFMAGVVTGKAWF